MKKIASFQFRKTRKKKKKRAPKLRRVRSYVKSFPVFEVVQVRGLVSVIIISFTLISKKENESLFFLLGTSTTKSINNPLQQQDINILLSQLPRSTTMLPFNIFALLLIHLFEHLGKAFDMFLETFSLLFYSVFKCHTIMLF